MVREIGRAAQFVPHFRIWVSAGRPTFYTRIGTQQHPQRLRRPPMSKKLEPYSEDKSELFVLEGKEMTAVELVYALAERGTIYLSHENMCENGVLVWL